MTLAEQLAASFGQGVQPANNDLTSGLGTTPGAPTAGGPAPAAGNPYDNNAFTVNSQYNGYNPNADVLGNVGRLAADSFDSFNGEYVPNPMGNGGYIGGLMNTAGMGSFSQGLDAFTSNNRTAGQGDLSLFAQGLDPSLSGTKGYSTATWKDLAQQFGVDPNAPDYQQQIKDKAKDYVRITGMDGTNPADPRNTSSTLYKKQADGTWAPIGQNSWSQREKGGFIQEHPGVLLPLGVAAGGALAAYAGAGAGAAGTGAAGTTGGATTAGAVGGAAGGTGAGSGLGSSLGSLFTSAGGSSGISGSIANALGMGAQWSQLPAFAQAAITSSLTNGGMAALQGGDIGKAMLMGGLTGGVGSLAGGALSTALGSQGAGLPSWAIKGLTSAGVGGLTSYLRGGNALQGALGGGLNSLFTTGLNEAGLSGGIANQLSGLGTNAALGAIFGGGSGGSSGGLSGLFGGGGSGGSAAASGSRSTGSAGYRPALHGFGVDSNLYKTKAIVGDGKKTKSTSNSVEDELFGS